MAIGAGVQGVVAIINVGCYYVIGIPIGLVLAFVAGLEVKVRLRAYINTSHPDYL